MNHNLFNSSNTHDYLPVNDQTTETLLQEFAPLDIKASKDIINNTPNTNISSSNITDNNNSNNNNNMAYSFNSPFFDIENFPITNPPIYEPDVLAGVVRRRVSISNGQIGQLREGYDNNNSSPENSNISSANNSDSINTQNQSQNQPFSNSNNPRNTNIDYNHQIMNNNDPTNSHQFNNYNSIMVLPNNEQPKPTNDPNFLLSNSNNNNNINSLPPQANSQPLNLPPGLQISQQNLHPHSQLISHQPIHIDQHNSGHHSTPGHAPFNNHPVVSNPHSQPLPGTAAWKRARLLERNRVAASKCRQKKKVAQQQLQKEAEQVANEAKLLRKKVDYLESTLSKMKDVMRNHMKSCNGSSVSLELLEEFLKLDEKDQTVIKNENIDDSDDSNDKK